MENQTRYDLNAAIEGWRQELAAQANLTLAVRRELETHLLDAITGFQQRGLNDEESFWLARRRVGQPQQLGEEFVKADPVNAWRERLFWMCLAVFLLSILGTIVGALQRALLPIHSSGQFVELANLAEALLPIVLPLTALITAVLMRSERTARVFSKLKPVVENRLRLGFTLFTLIGASSAISGISRIMYAARVRHLTDRWQLVDATVSQVIYALIFALLLIWLTPSAKRKTMKRA